MRAKAKTEAKVWTKSEIRIIPRIKLGLILLSSLFGPLKFINLNYINFNKAKLNAENLDRFLSLKYHIFSLKRRFLNKLAELLSIKLLEL